MTLILEYYNDYDQHGGYFVGVFDKTIEELKKEGYVFGRQNSEYVWNEAYEIKTNTLYESHRNGELIEYGVIV